MLSRGLKITFIVGTLLVACVILLHFVFRIYRTPTDAELEIPGTFFATFASTVLTFFIGALLFDYQIERTDAKRFRQLKLLLIAELSETLEALDPANAVEVQLSDNSSAEVVTTYVQPVILEQAIRDGFFDPSDAESATHLAGKIRGYSTKIAHLFSILSIRTTFGPGSGRLALHAIRDIEETRRVIVKDARSLIDHL
jgi:regulator of protease activity HflC (stomatin/prohibitin superfamily)